MGVSSVCAPFSADRIDPSSRSARPVRHALRHAGFRYTVLCHQARGLLIPGKDGKRKIFRVPADLATRLPG